MTREHYSSNIAPFTGGNMRNFESSQAGVTLLELMIALSLGLLLLTGIGTIFVGSNQTYRVQEQNARVQESGRYALDIVGRSLRQAGFWEMPVNPTALKSAFSGTPISGTNGASGASDTVTVQYDGVVGDSDCEGYDVTTLRVAADDAAAVLAGGIADNAMVITDAIKRDATELELVCDGIDADTSFQPLVSNVEDLQIQYGVDTDADTYQSANQYVDAGSVTNWNNVVSVRVCVLVRSEDQGITNTAQSYLNCAGALGTASGTAARTTASDSRLHRTFLATFKLRNRGTTPP